jgi:hypothetical protein
MIKEVVAAEFLDLQHANLLGGKKTLNILSHIQKLSSA